MTVEGRTGGAWQESQRGLTIDRMDPHAQIFSLGVEILTMKTTPPAEFKAPLRPRINGQESAFCGNFVDAKPRKHWRNRRHVHQNR